MKFNDYEQYNEIEEKMNDLKDDVVNNTNGLIEDESDFVDNYEEAVKYGEDNDANIQDGVTDMNGNNVDFDTQMRELDEQKSDLEFNLNKVFKIIKEIQQFVTIEQIEASRKSISTYLAISADQYDKFIEAFDGSLDMDNFEKDDTKNSFGVRISDHESGSHYVEALDRIFNYDSDYINIDINNF